MIITMDKLLATKVLIGFLLLQRNIIGTSEFPIDVEQNNSNPNGFYLWVGNEVPLVPEQLNDVDKIGHNFTINKIEKLDDFDQLKTLHYEASAHSLVTLSVMIIALTLVFVHLFVLEIFVRLTKKGHFQNSTRCQYLPNLHLCLSYLVCGTYVALIVLYYRNGEYCV